MKYSTAYVTLGLIFLLSSCQKENPKSDHQSSSEKKADPDAINIPLTFSPEIVEFEGFIGYEKPGVVEPQTSDQSALGGTSTSSSPATEKEIPPQDTLEYAEWISANMDDIRKRHNEILNLPENHPKEAIRQLSPELVEKIQVGMSYKTVLATLGMPTEQVNGGGGSGPPEPPRSWWSYALNDNSQFRLTFQFNSTFSDIVVVCITRPKAK